ncbi:oxidoreductase [Lysobacter helvus]|uniref:Oxidoreductase n=2 Tax=Lysobacteraceae TaxID=32033 RepID=A0ABN6FP30_9GAMM|nr:MULTISPECIES: FAD-dependent oxidoreductase [Lysobacter]BCT91325.1 oxidoreductase [Lysobacter caseinilyticus]BCT94478.1 oxidoreductase [Lysobacter helvus]
MDLKSGYPFWAVKNGLMTAFPPLRGDVRCDVAIVGGGITSALIARELAAHGHEVCVVEQRDIAWGSTAASTALLQYEIDEHLVDISKQYGDDNGALAYRACASAIDQLQDVSRAVRDVGFARCDSLYYASRPWHVRRLRAEGEARRRIGLDSRWLEADDIRDRYGIEAPAALLTSQAASVDPYRLASRIFQQLEKQGVAVHDRTTVTDIASTSRRVVLRTEAGPSITASHAILAAGYATQQWLDQRVARNRSSYAFISDPLEAGALGAIENTCAWETARPYLYLRTTPDQRLLVGGDDDRIDVPARRDARVEKKATKLRDRAQALLPRLPTLAPGFSWAGTFAETADGLPFFGAHAQRGPRVHYAMAYGGNGITYSMLGAGLLRAQIERRAHPLAKLFGFARLG